MYDGKISIIVPCYNEEDNVEDLYAQTLEIIKTEFSDYEFVLVDDGSRDGTFETIRRLASRDPRVKGVSFTRNYGHEIATTCGIDYATGDFNVIMDADLQDPPHLILDMTKKIVEEHYDVVYAVRRTRAGETFFKKASSSLFYMVHAKLSDIKIPRNTGDYRVFTAAVREDIKKMREKNRYMRGIISWVGYRQTGILFDRARRTKGVTKYNFFKLLNLALLGITSFSTRPLRLAFHAAAFSLLAFVFYGLYLLLSWIRNMNVPGWGAVVLIILLLNSANLLFFGVMGEYLSQIFYEVKDRPIYLVKDEINI